eukprot:729765-Rhodomonas_salina.4
MQAVPAGPGLDAVPWPVQGVLDVENSDACIARAGYGRTRLGQQKRRKKRRRRRRRSKRKWKEEEEEEEEEERGKRKRSGRREEGGSGLQQGFCRSTIPASLPRSVGSYARRRSQYPGRA